MALFPAYGCGDVELNFPEEEIAEVVVDSPGEGSSGSEARLLASDSDGEPAPRAVRAPSPPRQYFRDVRPDRGNLAVSTLYWPGRPQYRRSESRHARERRVRRYYQEATPVDSRAEELAARAGCFLRALADNPCDELLWLQYIEFEEVCREDEAALHAAERALAALPESRTLRAALHRVRVRVLPPPRLLVALRDAVAAPLDDDVAHLESWLRLLAALATAASPEEVAAAAAAALARLRRMPHAYPHVLYAYGAFLRDTGLWERLVLLVELVAAMNFPAGVFPPGAPDVAHIERQDHDLAEFEDKVIASGLPLTTVWVRVERARAAAHWRPALAGATDPDPQRRALPADVADLLLPVADPDAAFLLSVQLLRLAKVPLFPATEYVRRAVATAAGGLLEEETGAAWEASGAEALLPLVRAARRLPTAHPARPACAAIARDVLAHFLDPPHYFTDRAGYLSWVNTLWEASCEWATGEQRLALLCWRLRWLHALVLLVEGESNTEGEAAEARRIVSEARGALKRHAGGSPVAYVHFARIHLVTAGAERARKTALHALRAALGDATCPVIHRLYVARVAGEVVGSEALGAWPTLCAVLGVALPAHFSDSPDPELLERATLLCEERCAALAARGEKGGAGVCAAMLPGEGEWGGARVVLGGATGERRALQEVLRRRMEELDARDLRYLEQSACALVCRAARRHRLVPRARLLAPRYPHAALLALACSGATLGAWEQRGEGAAPAQRLRAMTSSARTHTAALAYTLPPLYCALAAGWHPREAERVRRACGRASRLGCGGALLRMVALEAEARGEGGGSGAQAVLVRALDALRNHKWVYVRGASACAAEGAALADMLLERQLRVHALREELQREGGAARL